VFRSGSEVRIDRLVAVASQMAAGEPVDAGVESGEDASIVPGPDGARPARSPEPLRDEMAGLEGSFIAALGHHDSRGAVAALLDLDAAIDARVRAGEDSPDLDNARSTFRALIARLGEAAGAAGADPRSTVDPFVETLLGLRARARDARDWATADLIRDRLIEAGVEVRDGADGSSWVLAGTRQP
jgi:cysteinyl-tRNA synthetase